MDISKLQPYHRHFIAALKIYMAEKELEFVKDAAKKLGIPYPGFYKVWQGTRQPSIQHCLILCRAGGFSANWLFLGHGDRNLEAETHLQALAKEQKQIRQLLQKSSLTG